VWRLSRRTLLTLCVVVICGAFALRCFVFIVGAWPQIACLEIPCRVDSLMAGPFVALCYKDDGAKQVLQRWAPAVGAFAACVVAIIPISSGHFNAGAPNPTLVSTLGIIAIAVLFSAVLIVAMQVDVRFLRAQPLVAIGRCSYGMYVFHLLSLTHCAR
jgi:peptidoglycan/LPS O-acetylase OafA/YrhL